MTTLEIGSGRDAWVLENKPNAERASGKWIRVREDAGFRRRGFIRPPIARQILGRTVLSATLYAHVGGTTGAQTLTLRRVSEPPGGFNKLNWNNQPGTVTPAVSTAIGALTDGDEVSWDITELVQPVAAGAPWYGLRIVTDDTTGAKFYSYDSGQPSWRVVIELSEELDQPADLTPDGGSVSSGAPILSWPAPDLGGTTDQAAFQVQVDPAMDEVTPDYDTGEVASVDPQHNLADDVAFTPIGSAATTSWRVRVKSEAGVWSDWSDWASFTHTPKPTLTITEPAGGSIYDPTPPVEFNVDSGALASYRVYVLDAQDSSVELYNSGRVDTSGASVSMIVSEFYKRRRVFTDDSTYRVRVRAWESGVTRAADVVNDPSYLQAEVVVTFDDDLAVEAPDSYAVTSVNQSPILTHTWTRSVDPDAFVVRRNGAVYAKVEPDDWTKDGTTYTWTDPGLAPGFKESTFTVEAIVGNRASLRDSVTTTPTPEGVWLITADLQTAMLRGGAPQFRSSDKVASYRPINSDEVVHVHYGDEGLAGSYDGYMYHDEQFDLDAALAVLAQIDANPTEPVRVVWASESRHMELVDLTYLPDDEFEEKRRRHYVRFDATERRSGLS